MVGSLLAALLLFAVAGCDAKPNDSAASEPAETIADPEYARAHQLFLAGLGEGEHLYVATIVTDTAGPTGRVTVKVTEFDGTTAVGWVDKVPEGFQGIASGDRLVVRAPDVVDWLIAGPNGITAGGGPRK